MPLFDRRSFLVGAASLAAAPALGQVPASGSVDVAIVGAGAAGIAAARQIAAARKSFALLEASNHVGGRCVTDHGLFGVPFDRGAHWIPASRMEPLAQIAARNQLDIYRAPNEERLRIGRRFARSSETEEFSDAQARANRAIREAARDLPEDTSCASALPHLGEWRATIDFVLGAYGCSKDLSEVSAIDFHKSEERERDSFCRQGFGTLIERAARELPVQLSTPVTEIEYSGRLAAVLKTPQGSLRARAVIVTASVGVLASGIIKFQPNLPMRHREAIEKLRLGSYDHIMLELPGNPLDLDNDDLIYEKATGNRTAALLANLSGSSLCMVDVAGSFGRSLASQGEAAMVDFGIGWLANLFGNNVKTAVKRRTATQWDRHPWVRGAFSAAAPGAQPSRGVLMESLNERIWFAGEAQNERLWGTVAGAWESGERAADAVIRRLGRS